MFEWRAFYKRGRWKIAFGEMSVDGKKIYSAERLKVGLFKDPSNF